LCAPDNFITEHPVNGLDKSDYARLLPEGDLSLFVASRPMDGYSRQLML